VSGQRDQRGFALLAVLLVLALVGIIGVEFGYSMRLEATAARTWKEGVVATHLAEAGVAQALREIVGASGQVAPGDDDLLTFYREGDRVAIPRLARKDVPFGGGQYSYRISDEEGRLNLNFAQPVHLDRLLQVLGLEKTDRDTIVDSIQDWRDPNEEHRLNGAESDDYYLTLPVPYRSRNGPFSSVAELRQVKGITAALVEGTTDRPGLADLLSVRSRSTVNINTASPTVLEALGLSSAEILEITSTRREVPYTQLPGRFGGGGRRLGVNTATFRIEAEGAIDGRVAARVTVVVRKDGAGAQASVRVLEWLAGR
jgi:general secretion pathway protein K